MSTLHFGSVADLDITDHTLLTNIGVNTHAQLDTLVSILDASGNITTPGDLTLSGADSQIIAESYTTTSGILMSLKSTPASASTAVIMQLEADGANWASGARVLEIITDDDDALPFVINNGSTDTFFVSRSGTIAANGSLQLTAGGEIVTTSNGNITFLPNGTGITIVGDSGSTGKLTSPANDDLEVQGRLAVGGALYSTFGTYLGSTAIGGDSHSLNGSLYFKKPQQTPDTSVFLVGSVSNHLLLATYISRNTDFANPQQTHPTLIWQNSDGNSIYGRGYIAHDNDDFTLQSHRGGFSFEVPAQYAQGTLSLAGGDILNNETFVINATTCTAKTSGAGSDEFDIAVGDLPTTCDNIVAMIAAGTESANVKSWRDGDNVVFEWKTAGTAGNAIVFTESMSFTTIDGGGTLGGTHLGVVAGTPLHADENGVVTVGSLEASTSVWYYHQQFDGQTLNPGGSGATLVPPDGNSIGGYQLDADTEKLYFSTDIHDNWDEVSDLEVTIGFDINVAGGAGSDTVDLQLLAYMKGLGEAATKLQTLEIATIVGTAVQYTSFSVTFLVDYADGSSPIDPGDKVGMILNLETDTSEVDNIIITHIETKYKTNIPLIEV